MKKKQYRISLPGMLVREQMWHMPSLVYGDHMKLLT
jgi:hypothetical protein